MKTFEEIEHTADRAFRAYGRDLRDLFTHAAHGVLAIEGSTPDAGPGVEREVEVAGPDRETLLVNWLNHLLYLQELHGEAYVEVVVIEIDDRRLRASLKGVRLAAPKRTIKAVTFHDLAITRMGEGWQATIVVDV